VLVRSPQPGRILIIDDEPPIVQLLQEALATEGHVVEVAVSGAEGVRKAVETRFDLVLSDLSMPDMTGWEVARRIGEGASGTPVVLVTGWGGSLTDEEIRDGGVAAVVQKPFEILELLETTSRLLDEARRREPTG